MQNNGAGVGVSCRLTQGAHPVLCDNLEGWDGVGGGREASEGGGICILMGD